MSDFDVEGARKAGYSDTEIADHLAKQNNYDAAGARKAGYSDSEILSHLTKPAAPPSGPMSVATPTLAGGPRNVQASAVSNPSPQQPGFLNRIASGIDKASQYASDTISNIPSNALEVGKGFVGALSDPVGTAKAVGSLGAGLASKLGQPAGPMSEAEAKRVAPVEAPLNAFVAAKQAEYKDFPTALETLKTKPVSTALDFSTLAAPVGGSLRGMPGTLGKIGEAVQTAGRAVDPISNVGRAIKGVGNVVEPVASNVLGGMTGMTARDVRASGRAGLPEGGNDAFWGQYTGKADKTVPVDLAESAFGKKIAEKNAEYRSGMHDISQDRAVLKPDEWASIDEALAKANNVGKFKGAVIEGEATGINNRIQTLVNDWKTLNPESPIFKEVPKGELTPENFHTPEGLDALKRAIGDVRNSTDRGTPARVAADRAYNAVRKEIVNINPKYGEVMGKYSDAMDEVGEIRKALSIGGNASADTALGKLQSTSRQTAQTRGRVQMVDELAKLEPDLPYALAGQNANALAPRGLTARLGFGTGASTAATVAALVHNPALAAAIIPAAIASMPKVVGGAAYGGGRVAGIAGRAADKIHLNPDTIRALEQLGYQSDQTRQNNALAR